MTIKDVMTQVAKFSNQDMAVHYQFRKAGRWIILGDDGKYWVTTWRYAKWLQDNGYELFN
jgi:hypothetical protein